MITSLDSGVRGFSLADVRKLAADARKTFWIGAASFEERCCGAMATMIRERVRLSCGVILDYQTNLGLDPDGDRNRQQNLDRLRRDASAVFPVEPFEHPVDAYSFAEFAAFLRDVLSQEHADLTVIDITCLTKIHTLALAAELAKLSPEQKWVLSYTLPENYGGIHSESAEGWRDVIIAPLAQSARLFNEEYSRGIILLGHEADRLVFALSELEPSGGIIVHVDTPRRPDWKLRSAAVNRRTIRRLRGMRFADWEAVSVDSVDYGRVASLVGAQIDSAKSHGAPVILFPFGPKSLISNVALRLAADYDQASWFVYPVPQQYDAGYTEGIADTRWFGIA
ncbi:MAG: hypothetical protein Q7S20_02825 [Gemmatimonadaceae bacterium]|nr:hypothetical protein [Gemmatimonadaceae bacterium]